MDSTKVKSRVLKSESINWRELLFIQQENFKELPINDRERLKASFVQNGFADPFKVWEDKTGQLWCLDGKHRTLLLQELCEDGANVPILLPAVFIKCNSKKEAAKLVLVYSSQYAHITQQGYFEFLEEYKLDYLELKEFINIPEFSEERFEQKFDFFEIMAGEEPEVSIDDKEVIVKPGDIFQLNSHRLICGSFESEEDISALMNGEKARIVNCDPPYNIPVTMYKSNNGEGFEDFAMGVGEMTDDQFVGFLANIMQKSMENTVPGAIHYIFMDWRHVWHMMEASRQVYGTVEPKQLCVWNKDRMANGSFYRSKHELCFVFKSGKEKHLSHLELKNRIRTNVWDYAGANSADSIDKIDLSEHPTPKSTQMIADAILDTTNLGDVVIDWFLGSGTCLIACEHTGRHGRFTEIEPKYVQSSIIRFINYCSKRSIKVKFTHLNGNLTIDDFMYEQTEKTN
jgi:DNA modification methylase